MIENAVKKCNCDAGFENGAILKNIDEKDFEIYGNLTKNNFIVIKYKGKLKEICVNKEPGCDLKKIYLVYYFNNDISTLKTIELTKCLHAQITCFCTLFELEFNNSLSFYFIDSSGIIDNNDGKSYNYDITFDQIKILMEKYCGKENKNLPKIAEEKSSLFSIIAALFIKIKNYMKIGT